MQRIPPSEQIRKQLDDLLNNGLAGQENMVGTLVQLGAQLVVQELLEREMTEQLGRAHYQHRKPDELLRGHRNGYEPGRLRTAEGDIPVHVPSARLRRRGAVPFEPDGLLAREQRCAEATHRGDVCRGLPTREIEDALQDATGKALLSRTAVSELSETLWEDYQAFCERDLSWFAVEYLFIDAVYEGLRQWSCSQGLLCA